MQDVLTSVRAFIASRGLLHPGERVAVAVSGGADSVALLRLLLELRQELGIVLSVAHLNHQLRGADAERDADFVGELAERHGLEFHLARRDVSAYAVEHKLSLEAAGRHLRYGFFSALVDEGKVNKVATAHTLDDQAETVLLKLLRGSWLRGLAGIHERLCAGDGRIWVVRPLLGTSRQEVEAYLHGLAQPWREDRSNQDRRFRRNRVRQLLSLLEAEHHPGVRASLAQVAELARAEESYWAEEIARIAPGFVSRCDAESVVLDSELLTAQPLALQRRLVRYAAEKVRLKLDFDKVERLRLLLSARDGSRCQLTAGWEARKQRSRSESHLLISRSGTDSGVDAHGTEHHAQAQPASAYEYRLRVPGEVHVPEARQVIKVSVVEVSDHHSVATLLDPKRIEGELTVRNWRPGDRYHPLGEEREKKLKVYFQQYRIPLEKRTMWPLVFSNQYLVWALGMPVASGFAFRENTGLALQIEGVPFFA